MLRSVVLLAIGALSVAAQQTGRNVQPGAAAPTFSTGTQLVVETVSVTDKQGRAVEGLTPASFQVTEDGVKQEVKVFEFQRLAGQLEPAPAFRDAVTIYSKLGRTQIAAEAPGDTRYKDRRLLALYFDMSSMPVPDQMRALAAAQSFIRSRMATADLAAILRYNGGAVEVLSDFTADRARLLSILQTLVVGEGQGFEESAIDAATPDTGAAFGQDDSEFNIFNTDRQLSALQTAARMLSVIAEKKALVYFASGLRLNGLNNQAQLRATVNAAVRAGVSFWPVDARGLVAAAPLGDAAHAAPGNAAMYTGAAALAGLNDFQQSQDTLYALAADTGGKALFDDNRLERGIEQAAASISSYYVIGYYSSNPALDGKFRRIRITLEPALDARLDYRQGYFAGRQFGKFTAADKERQLEDALMLADPITELTIAMEIDYFQMNRAEYYVPVTLKIPGRELALAKRGGAERTVIDFIGEVKNSAGSTVSNVRDKVSARLSEATAAELARRPIVYDTGFTLLPGKYTIKVLARDDETGRIGTYQTSFSIPNLNLDSPRQALSSVVLSSQRIELKEAIFNAQKEKLRADHDNPLVNSAGKLIPSVTRVFTREQHLRVFLQAYQQNVASVQPVLAYLSLYRGQEKAFESAPIEVAEAPDKRLRVLSLEFDLALAGIEPGRYDCQVTVLNPQGGKANFWQANIVLLP